ncbi:MAG: PASTA domain-containing protein [Ruminococcaceae bacterium]|nr:PASTA domain-containing protein [Oscillospiraceae bacterium]
MEGGTPSNKVLRRATAVGVTIVVLLLLLCLRIFCIQIFQFDEYEQKVIDQITQVTPVAADRGVIYDTNGIVLATNITTYRLFIDPAVISQQSSTDSKDYASIIADGLSKIESLNITYDDVMKQTEYTKYRDRTIQKHISEESADEVRVFLEQAGIDNLALVHLQATSKRYYPYGNLASHVLGFTNSDGDGIYGLELQYNDKLKGTDGKYVTAKDSLGNEMPYDYESYIPAVDGYNVVTTIDVYIQAELEEQLKQAYLESGGQNRACGVVMDVNTGAVLAMATYPDFDLNDPWKLNEDCETKMAYCAAELAHSGFAEGTAGYAKMTRNLYCTIMRIPNDEEDQSLAKYEFSTYEDFSNALSQALLLGMWNNKATTEVYMPGSTFKVITAAMAYEEDLVVESEQFSCPGYHVVAGQKIKCHKISGHGSLNFPRGLQQSCNPVLMMMGARIGQDNFYNYFNSFGYFDKTGIDIQGEGQSIFWDKDLYYSSEVYLATASFGQNFKISVMQHLSAINAVANGGELITPHLIKEIRDNDGHVIYSHEVEVKRQVIGEETSRIVSQILEEGVATDGGGKNAYVAGYRVAAKTGTSEKKDIDDTQYRLDGESYTPYVCSTVAYAPADNPQMSVIIMVDEPTEGTLYGSVVAAPYIGKLFEEVLPYYGVESVFTEDELEKQAIQTPWLIALELDRAKELADMYGVQIEIVGDGKTVLAQSPDPLTLMEKGSAKVVLYTTTEAKNNRKTVIVPDLIGSTAVAANGTLTSYGLNIKISGTKNYMSGTGAVVYEQSIPAGTEVEIGTVVELHFRYLDPDD